MDGWDERADITQFLSMIDTSYLPRNLLQVHGKHLALSLIWYEEQNMAGERIEGCV